MARRPKIKVLLLNDAGTGFPEYEEVPEGMTLGDFIEKYLDGNPGDYRITVNGSIEPADYELKDNDKVIATLMQKKVVSGRKS